jgi:hypothetical protein
MKRRLALIAVILLSCSATGNFLYASPAPQKITQDNTIIKGSVVDEKGEPVISASITEIGSTRGAITDVDGNFSLNTTPGAKIQISYLGYKTVITKAANGMKVQLAPDNAMLDEVVAVGYGQQKKVDLTGAVANVDLSQTLASRPEQGRCQSPSRGCPRPVYRKFQRRHQRTAYYPNPWTGNFIQRSGFITADHRRWSTY